MRINKYIAQATGLSRRAADAAIAEGLVRVNGEMPPPGLDIKPDYTVTLDNRVITPPVNSTTIMLNKPVGYVCSRNGQGSRTIYELLPEELHNLKSVGRLDKNTSGLLLLTNDGELANKLTHPRYEKKKIYEITLDNPLDSLDKAKLEKGVMLDDGLSKFSKITEFSPRQVEVVLSEGRNRQIRRTFEALGYKVTRLHRISFGDYKLSKLDKGTYQTV